MAEEGPTRDRILEVRDLKVSFYGDFGIVKAVDGVSFDLHPGETLGIVGESGCGKSATALAIMQLVRSPGKITGGEINFYHDGRKNTLTALDPQGSAMRAIRGNRIAMVFQEPMTSLNPVFTIGYQIAEALVTHQRLSRSEARAQAVRMLEKVGISLPERRFEQYPHEFSGGMRQRVMIAMALCCQPSILIADEPTTALDVTIQAQVLELMIKLKEEFRSSIIMITHDLGVIASMAKNVVVMYLGRIVEKGDVRAIFKKTKHPYTRALLSSVPSLIGDIKELKPIQGFIPEPSELPGGCRFRSRCPELSDRCHHESPPLIDVGENHFVSCWLYG
jgi:peptide/nickel transport system ATP-binding protein/oligopeptide transport system ATP-binding protein